MSRLDQIKGKKIVSKLSDEEESSSDDSVDISPVRNTFRHANDVKELDQTKLHVYHINNFSKLLADSGFTEQEVLRCFEMMEIQSESKVKFPKEDARNTFAETVGQLSLLDKGAREMYLSGLTGDNSRIRDEFSAMLHHLGVKGIVFVDPELSLAYTTSEAFFRYVCSDAFDNLKAVDFVVEGVGAYLKSISGAFSSRTNSPILNLMKTKIYEVTGMETFLNTPIDVTGAMSNKKVHSGSIKATHPLPFLHPVDNTVSAKAMKEVVVSRAIQDITGLIPITKSKGASCSQSIQRYVYPRFNVSEDLYQEKGYVMPIKIAANGYYGDENSTDIFQKEYTTDGDPLFIPDKLKMFGPPGSGPYYDPRRQAVSCADASEIEFADDTVGVSLPAMFATGKVLTIGDDRYIPMDYSPTTFDDFVDVSSIRLIDFATYCTMGKERIKLLQAHVCVIVSAFSQLILVVPRYLIEKYGGDPGQHFLNNSRSASTAFLDPDYILPWVGIAKKLPAVFSASYVAAVLLLHKSKKSLIEQQELVDEVLKTYRNATRGKIDKALVPSVDTMTIFVEAVWVQELGGRPHLCPFVASKNDAPGAYDAVVAMSENVSGFSPYDDDLFDKQGKKASEVYKFIADEIETNDFAKRNSKHDLSKITRSRYRKKDDLATTDLGGLVSPQGD
jgi:hypothetical protein